jgi:ankyrin repeat protein
MSNLAKAIKNNDLHLTAKLLERGLDPNEDIFDGLFGNNMQYTTPLMIAIKLNSFEMVNLLLMFNADTNKPKYYLNDYGKEITRMLSRKKTDWNEIDRLQKLQKTPNILKTPLAEAAEYSSFEIVELLIKNYAKSGRTGFPPLYYAVSRENIDMVKLLLPHGYARNSYVLKAAKESQNDEIYNLIINIKSTTVITEIATEINDSKSKNIINDKTVEKTLDTAIENNDISQIELMLKQSVLQVNDYIQSYHDNYDIFN